MDIQRLVLFEDDKVEYDKNGIMPLYYRKSNDVHVDKENKEIAFHKNGAEISFDTYFNSFSINKWKKYTVIDKVSFRLEYKGELKVQIFKASLKDNSTERTLVLERTLSAKEREQEVICIDKFPDDGIIYPAFVALEDSSVLYEAAYVNELAEMTHKVKLSIDICTFKREQYVKRNMLLLKKEILNNTSSPLYGNMIVNISDNGQSLDGIVDSEEFIKVRKNLNLGGVGGFTRGIIETKKVADDFGITHVLIMDDDAEISISAIEQTYMLLSFIKEEYRGHTVGGQLLILNMPTIQYESGAQWNRGNIKALQHKSDLSSFKQVLINDAANEDIEYAGWWYCCIPLEEIDDNNLPLPIFIHRDDIEYGLRVGKKRFISMNGISIWHESFDGKMPGVLEYYDIRNLAITNAIHYKDYTKKQFKKFLLKWVLANIAKYRYKYIAFNLKAVEDFCKGIDWLIEEDANELHKELFAMNYKAKPAKEYIGYKNIKSDDIDIEEAGDYKLPLGIRAAQFIVLNGYLLPAKKNKVLVSTPYDSVYRLFRIKENLVIDANGNSILFKRSIKEFFECLNKVFKTLKIVDKNYDEAAKSYRDRYKEIVSMEFWKKYLEISD